MEQSYKFWSRKKASDTVKVLTTLPLDDIRVYVGETDIVVYLRIDSPTQELVWKLEGIMAQGEYLGAAPLDKLEEEDWIQVFRGEGVRGFKAWSYSRRSYKK